MTLSVLIWIDFFSLIDIDDSDLPDVLLLLIIMKAVSLSCDALVWLVWWWISAIWCCYVLLLRCWICSDCECFRCFLLMTLPTCLLIYSSLRLSSPDACWLPDWLLTCDLFFFACDFFSLCCSPALTLCTPLPSDPELWCLLLTLLIEIPLTIMKWDQPPLTAVLLNADDEMLMMISWLVLWLMMTENLSLMLLCWYDCECDFWWCSCDCLDYTLCASLGSDDDMLGICHSSSRPGSLTVFDLMFVLLCWLIFCDFFCSCDEIDVLSLFLTDSDLTFDMSWMWSSVFVTDWHVFAFSFWLWWSF